MLGIVGDLAKRIFGSSNERYVRSLQPIVARINALEPEIAAMSDAELRGQTDKFRARLQGGEGLDDLLPEAFATVREAAKRPLGQRIYGVQVLGGMVLPRGEIAEMRAGERKPLGPPLAPDHNAIGGSGAHAVAAHD